MKNTVSVTGKTPIPTGLWWFLGGGTCQNAGKGSPTGRTAILPTGDLITECTALAAPIAGNSNNSKSLSAVESLQQVKASLGQGIGSAGIVLIMQGGVCHVYSGSFSGFLESGNPGNDIGTTSASCVNVWITAPNPSNSNNAKSLSTSPTKNPPALYNLTWNTAKGVCQLYNDSVYVSDTTVAKGNCGPQIVAPTNTTSSSVR